MVPLYPGGAKRTLKAVEFGMPIHWKFECPNRKSRAKDKISTCCLDVAQSRSVCQPITASVNKQVVNTHPSGQSSLRSISLGKSVNIDSSSSLSGQLEDSHSPVGR